MRIVLGASLAALLALAAPSVAQEAGSRAAQEHEVKAAYLFKFLAFIEWPPGTFQGAEQPITVGVLGSEALADAFEGLTEGRAVQGRAVETRRLKPGEATADLHVVFVGRSQEGRLTAIARSVRGRPVLVVSESPGALDDGSAVNFIVVGGRVRFEVSLEAAERSGLRISSRMLAVATNVKPARP